MKKILPLILVIILFVTGCGSTEDNKGIEESQEGSNIPVANEQIKESDTVESNAEINEVRESDIGKLTIIKKNEEVGAIQESGPFTVKVNKMQVSRLEVSEEFKNIFDDKDVATIITLEVEVENKSTETNIIYPDQGTVVTNTKEQKDADLFLSGHIGGEYIGEVIKKDNIIFVLDSEAEEINSFKYIISGPIDSDWNTLGEDITFELSF